MYKVFSSSRASRPLGLLFFLFFFVRFAWQCRSSVLLRLSLKLLNGLLSNFSCGCCRNLSVVRPSVVRRSVASIMTVTLSRSFKSTLHTLSSYPQCPNFSSFRSRSSRFREIRLLKIGKILNTLNDLRLPFNT